MSLKKMTKEELELLSYTDLTEMILEENKKAMNTPTIFRTICDLLELSDSDYTNKIGDFYTSLTTDKRFLFLEDSAEWDLKDRHVIDIVVTDDDEEEEIEPEEEEEISTLPTNVSNYKEGQDIEDIKSGDGKQSYIINRQILEIILKLPQITIEEF